MGRRRKKGRAISGWIVLDKNYDVGSTECVSKVRWLFDAKKCGHAGTLDPLATGILPVALGEATKTVPFVMEARKTYRFTAKWGQSTRTDDIEGDVIATSDVRPDKSQILACLDQFTGDIEQVPPQFSAVKINGERAYDIARGGDEVEIAPRTISIYSLTLIDQPSIDEAVFEAETGKGTYVRALVRDMAKALGTEGHITQLRRTAVGPFHEDDAVTIDEIENTPPGEARDEFLAGLDLALRDLPSIGLDGPQTSRLRHGQPALLSPAQAKGLRGDSVGAIESVLAVCHDDPVAICSLDGLKLQPSRLFMPDDG